MIMTRRSRAAALVTSSVLLLSAAGVALAAGEGGGLGLPTAGCNTFTDPKGDAVPGAAVIDPIPDPIPNDPDLDITGVVMGTSASKVSAYIRVDALGDGPQFSDGDAWNVVFTARGKEVSVWYTRSALPVNTLDGAPGYGTTNYVDIDGTTVDGLEPSATFDQTASVVIVSVDRKALETALGGALAGTALTKLSASANTSFLAFPADDAAAPATASFAVDSNPCFGGGGTPAPGPTTTPPTTPPSSGGGAVGGGKCPTYTDPADDNAIDSEPTGQTAEPETDLLAVSHSVDSGVFTTVLKVAALSDTGPANAFFDRFSTSFTVAKKTVTIAVDRDFTADPTAVATSLVVAGAATTTKVTAAFDTKASTVTLGVTAADLEKAVGAPLAGQPFSAMTSAGRENFTPGVGVTGVLVLQLNDTDTATAPATASYLFGQSCSGGGTPVPDPTPTETGGGGGGTDDGGAEGPPPLFALPRAGCYLYKDPAGDAIPGSAPLSFPQNDNDLDFTQMSAKSAPDALTVYARVAALGDAPDTPFYAGHKFTTSFVINGKTITAVAEGPGAATTTPATAKATAVFDKTKSYVEFTFPKADLATAAGAPITNGTPITNIAWVSNGTTPLGDFDGDTAAGATPAEKSYSYGDNTCFQPPPAVVTIDTTGRGVYSDASVVDVTLADTDDNGISGAKVHLQLTGMPSMTLVTDDDGIAEFTFPVTVPAGSKTLTATFLGNADASPAGAGASFTVVPETTVLKAVAGKGSVTATLTDNDKTPLVGQLVSFTVGKKVTKVKTNAKGVAVLSKQKAGSSVTVGFAAVTGKYAAAKAVSAKVR